jgi:hypothetical protein
MHETFVSELDCRIFFALQADDARFFANLLKAIRARRKKLGLKSRTNSQMHARRAVRLAFEILKHNGKKPTSAQVEGLLKREFGLILPETTFKRIKRELGIRLPAAPRGPAASHSKKRGQQK